MPPLFPLLDLPPELREKIYLHNITSSTPIPLTPDSELLLPPLSNPKYPLSSRSRYHQQQQQQEPLHPLFPHALLLTNHQIYQEVRPLYFTHNTFLLHLVRDIWPLQYFLAPTFRDHRRHIRGLQVVISRWGRGDFFVDQCAPALEDMILNGGLRDLEVWTKGLRSYLGGRNLELLRKEREAVERLLRILRDPYLERVVLKTTLGFEIATLGAADLIDASMEDVTSLIDLPKKQVAIWGYRDQSTDFFI